HLTVFAENNTGYHNLIKASSDAFIKGTFYKPRTDWEFLSDHSEGLMATSGCLGGPVLQHLLHDDLVGATKTAARLQATLGKENFFIELQDHGLPEPAKTNPQLLHIAKTLDAPTLACNDSHYCHHEDALGHDALLCVPVGAKIADQNRFKFQSDQHYLKTAEE